MFGPRGNPIINQPTTIKSQTTINISTVGLNKLRVPNTVILFVSLLLYFSKKASIIIKYTKKGVIPLPTLSAALKINWVKSGVIFAFMNNGINIGDAICHFVMVSGINKDINIIIINIVIIKGIPVNSKLLINEMSHEPKTVPIFVQFRILIISDEKNNSINMYPKLSNSFDNPTLKSFVFFRFFEIAPYIPEQIIIIIRNIKPKASWNGAFSPSNCST